MDTHDLKLSVFVYNKKIVQSLLLHMICKINNDIGADKGIVIGKKWQHGPHIEMILPDDKGEARHFEELLTAAAEEFIGSTEIPQDESCDNYEKLAERVAVLEGYKGSYLPLKKHLEICCEEFDWKSIDTIFPHELYRETETMASRFIFEAMPYYSSLSENDKLLFLTECMVILGNQQEKTEELSGGIKYGYMTFQSHYQGFRAQLRGSRNESEIMNILEQDNRYVVESLIAEMEELIRMKTSAEHCSEKERILDLWRSTVDRMLYLYEKVITEDRINWNDSQYISGFFERNSSNLSSFHEHLQDKKNYMDFLNSVFFVKHRLTINEFYKQLPLFGISPLRKHQLCKYVSEAVEEYYSQDYDEIIEKIGTYYR